MALKLRRGTTVPSLQPGEPFFDGNNFHIGSLDNTGNKQIGGVPIYVVTDADLGSDSNYYLVENAGIYIIAAGVDVMLDIDILGLKPNDYIKVYNSGPGYSISFAQQPDNYSIGAGLTGLNYVEFLIVSMPNRPDVENPLPVESDNGLIYLYSSTYIGQLTNNNQK